MSSENLERFVVAQQDAWESARAELAAGRKATHWMWFVFPQIAGLGQSPMARHYALGSLAEARAYLAHPVLGTRLREGVELALRHRGSSAERIFGGIDAMKFRSSLTLFARAAPDDPTFTAALDAFYGGEADDRTDQILKAAGDPT
jgi:uncharacterized protein (DUF1810 family)